MEKELVLCDSNIIINWFKNDHSTINVLEQIGLTKIVIPSITIMEIYQGALNNKELMQLKKKMNNYKIIHFDKRVSALAIQLIIKYNLSHNLLIPDAIIWYCDSL